MYVLWIIMDIMDPRRIINEKKFKNEFEGNAH